jgi:hypothetical protein
MNALFSHPYVQAYAETRPAPMSAHVRLVFSWIQDTRYVKVETGQIKINKKHSMSNFEF